LSCQQCGVDGCGGCDAEATLGELLAMRDGRQASRCVKVTPLQLAAMSGVVDANCEHRGAELRTEACSECGGNVRIKVFACSRNGECTIGKRLEGVAVCGDA
jgi:hypothetical protein